VQREEYFPKTELPRRVSGDDAEHTSTVTAIVSAWTSRPRNRTVLMTGSFRMSLCVEVTPSHSVTNALRIGAGRSIVTKPGVAGFG